MCVHIERPEPAEIVTLADRWVELAREQRDHGAHVEAGPNRETILGVLQGHHAADEVLVARADSRVVGFVTFTMETGALELAATRGIVTNLYVEPSARSQGIGSRLLRAAEEALDRRGATVVVLEVLAANERARQFYRAQGYRPHRVTMGKPLDESGAE